MTKLVFILTYTFFQLFYISIEGLTSCYNGTSYWTGLKTGMKEECGEQTSYCFIIWGKTVHGGSTRGCAPHYIEKLCDELKPNNSKNHVNLLNCFTVDTAYVKGRVCCCDQNLCNLSSKNYPLISTVSIFTTLLLLY